MPISPLRVRILLIVRPPVQDYPRRAANPKAAAEPASSPAEASIARTDHDHAGWVLLQAPTCLAARWGRRVESFARPSRRAVHAPDCCAYAYAYIAYIWSRVGSPAC